MEMIKRKIKLHFSPKIISRWNPNPQFYFSSLFFSTRSQTQSSSSSESSKLYDRIQIVRDPKESIIPVLNQWVSEGHTVGKALLQSLVHLMKGYKRFNHALEMSHWMTDCRYFSLSPSDVAVRLELIYRVYGSAHAEMYFEKISDKLKSGNVYGALLSGYVRENSVQKAEAVLQEMREKGIATSSFPYNIMINLYAQNGAFEKIDILKEEMERNGIPQDKYTMRNLMAAYVAASDISGMERILNQLETHPQLGHGWQAYSVAASGYLKVGLIEKALKMLRKMEETMPIGKKTSAFNYLLTLYAKTGRKDELYRVWNSYKPLAEVKETQFCCMISSLEKVDDIEGAERIFEEWESQCMMYDFRVLNKLLLAYCRKGLYTKAEAAFKKAAEGRTPYASTWITMAMSYIGQNQMSKAVEMLKKAISVSRKGWKPNPITLTTCLDYLEEQGDVEGIEEIVKSLKSTESLTRDIYHRLVRTYTAAGIPVTKVIDKMKMDNIAADEETHKILES
ncbi:pentatricopeptide repeat-containing protein At2g20710, mitochondrial [Ricinus communis]|uniref:Pentatricopeptide repeat-containing protein, putative n=1 Tax=Ricinus communis TaxID=3988 RepID=B9RW08_RICCO|nr:pentatricopeptide repeat-containing protein At2g20710, mitochondrial [Ricinus communis]EEF44445.1 pentatricopeptide repeat-containing protein, putative [Ricinus communis]|eukprot:XP_002517927.1 pentatricopeptide repeat-containing protein At2g20710, mitochondrial [Ricinus communis]